MIGLSCVVVAGCWSTRNKVDHSFEAQQGCEQREQNAVALVGRCSCAEKIGRAGGFVVDAGGHAAEMDHDESFPPPVRVEVHTRRYTNGTKGTHLIRAKQVPCQMRT